MLKGIIFDMDGVLINSEPFHYQVWKEVLKQRGIEISYEIYKPCIGSTVGFLMEILHEHYGVDPKDRSLPEQVKITKDKMIQKQGYPQLVPYVKEMLERFQKAGYSMAVASSSPKSYIEQVTAFWGIDHYFKILVSGEQVKSPKPAPDVFLKVAEILGLSSDECLVIEDSENGCKAAKAAHMTCMAYYNPDSGKQNLNTAAVVVEGFEEIDALFAEKIYCHNHHLPALVCETERLLIKEMEQKDIPRLMEICAQETSQDACEGIAKPLEEELEGFEAYRRYMYELCDMGYWCVIKKDTGEIIGRAGVEPKYWNDSKTVVEMGYVIDEKFRQQGFAYEACKAILKVSEQRGAYYLHCRIKRDNQPSVELAKKLGFVKTDYRLNQDSEDMEVWRYTCS
ncbi:MAG: GNAT family N-acetyltransferase [Blautia sp.]|uniref:GNAT family N-acetyltransferase n=1 Tax=Blautia sp. TaxID=1955243 RepID=UPI002E76E3E0|nr:GNAT family N-acetyltransferase [Blautia sp.]MEE1443968.1 GNAT family N-acetyltransferase [Blautia sp.]